MLDWHTGREMGEEREGVCVGGGRGEVTIFLVTIMILDIDGRPSHSLFSFSFSNNIIRQKGNLTRIIM